MIMTPAAADSETLRKTLWLSAWSTISITTCHSISWVPQSASVFVSAILNPQIYKLKIPKLSLLHDEIHSDTFGQWTEIACKKNSQRRMSLGAKKTRIPSLTCSKHKQCVEHRRDQQKVCKHRWTLGKISFASRLRGVTCVSKLRHHSVSLAEQILEIWSIDAEVASTKHFLKKNRLPKCVL